MQLEPSYIICHNAKWYLKDSLHFYIVLSTKYLYLYHPVVPLSIINQEKWKHFPHKGLYVNIGINLFIIVNIGIKAKIHLSNYISKLQYSHMAICQWLLSH